MKKFIYLIVFFIFVFLNFNPTLVVAQTLNEIKNLRAGKHNNFYRIVLETSLKVDTEIELRKTPYRAIIKMQESLWRANDTPRKGNFLPNIPIFYSFKNDKIGKTNLVLNLEKPFSLDKIFWLSNSNGNERLVIDLYIRSETDFIVTKNHLKAFLKRNLNLYWGKSQ